MKETTNPNYTPHPSEVRALRISLGGSLDDLLKAAQWKTKRSWWLTEIGVATMPAWRWNAVQEAVERGEILYSQRSMEHTRKAKFLGDALILVSDNERAAIGKSIRDLAEFLGFQKGALVSLCKITRSTITHIMDGTSRMHTTSKRVSLLYKNLKAFRVRAEKAMKTYQSLSSNEQLTPAALKALRLGLRVSQKKAGHWAAPDSVSPDALMSAYETEAHRIPAASAAKLSEALVEWHQKMITDPGWDVLASAPFTPLPILEKRRIVRALKKRQAA